MVDVLFDENYVMKAYAKELREEGREEGVASAYIRMYKEGLIKSADAARMLEISEIEFMKLAKKYVV